MFVGWLPMTRTPPAASCSPSSSLTPRHHHRWRHQRPARSQEDYEDYEVRYIYVVDDDGHLAGVVQLREMILARGSRTLGDTMKKDPIRVPVDKSLDGVEDIFDRHNFKLIPVVDDSDRLVGIVDEADLHEAMGEQAEDNLGKPFGIRGEELRLHGFVGTVGPPAWRSLHRIFRCSSRRLSSSHNTNT